MKTLKDLSLLSLAGWNSFLKFRGQKISGFSVGIPTLDQRIGGLSGIVGIQGEPGSCKSTFALQIATHNASMGVPVLIVDRENGANRFRQRILSQVNHKPQEDILKCSEEQLKEYFKPLKGMPMYVDTSFNVSIAQISSYLTDIYKEHQRPMLLVVDSLQALPKGRDDERMALQEWIEGLDQLKLDFEGNLVIIMTSEKSRGRYGIASKEAGKGTGSIEFKCEQLIDMRSMDSSRVIAVQLVKNRDGVCFNDDFFLVKQLANSNPASFVFKLAAAGKDEVSRLSEEMERASNDGQF